jgi:hypothetical protein
MHVDVWAHRAAMSEKFLRHVERIAHATFGYGPVGVRRVGVRFGDPSSPGPAVAHDCEVSLALADGSELAAYARDLDAAVCFYQAARAAYETLEAAAAGDRGDVMALPLAAE